MIEDPTVLYVPFLIMGAFFMLFGVMLGLAAARMSGSKERKKLPGEKKVDRPGLVEVARFWHEQSSGKLVIEVGGKLFNSRRELDENLKSRLIQLFQEIREWFGVTHSEAAQPAPRPVPAFVSRNKPVVTSPPVESQPVSVKEPALQATPPSMNMIDVVSSAVKGGSGKKDAIAQPKSIASQIDAILQEKIQNSPLYSRGIRLVDIPGGGIQVVIGSERFESVSEIRDPQIKALIQACVAEWENKNYPT